MTQPSSAQIGSPEQRSPSAAAVWGIMLLLSLGVLIAYADRASISAAIANQQFIDHFGMSDVERGIVGSAFFWSYALAQIPMGWVVDRYGVKLPYALCFALWCCATAGAGIMTAFSGLVIMRLIVGATEAVVMPASYRWIRHNVPERHTGAAIGLFAMGNKIGTALGAPLAAWLIILYDWRAMFVITGLLGLAGAMDIVRAQRLSQKGGHGGGDAAGSHGAVPQHHHVPCRMGRDDREFLLRLFPLLLHDLDAGLSGGEQGAVAHAIGPLYLLQLRGHRRRRHHFRLPAMKRPRPQRRKVVPNRAI